MSPEPCHSCRSPVDESALKRTVAPLRDLTAEDFNVCASCATVYPDACVVCGNGVYVPRNATTVPDYCPACRAETLGRTGRDPGWECDAASA